MSAQLEHNRVQEAAADGAGLVARRIAVRYGVVPAVRGIDLECRPGQVVGVVGPNGAGKTSLLMAMAGLVKASGSVHLDGTNVSRWPGHRRGQAGIVMVEERRRVFPSLSVRENLAVGGWGLPKAELEERVEAMFELFPRLRERTDVPAFRLSGGEQRMVSIGRALVTGAQCLLLDELSLGLAPRIVNQLVGTVRQLADEGRMVVLVEQYIGVLLRVADYVHVVNRGRVRFSGPTAEAAEWLEAAGYLEHVEASAASR